MSRPWSSMQGGVCLRRVPPTSPRDDLAERFPDAAGAAPPASSRASALCRWNESSSCSCARAWSRRGAPSWRRCAARRAALRTGFEPRLRPLMVTTLGRTGSTRSCACCSAHPEIAAYRPFEYEPRVATLLARACCDGLAEPASYRRQITPSGHDRRHLVGGRPTRRSRAGSATPSCTSGSGRESVETLAEFCQSRIDALYDAGGAAVRIGRGRASSPRSSGPTRSRR